MAEKYEHISVTRSPQEHITPEGMRRTRLPWLIGGLFLVLLVTLAALGGRTPESPAPMCSAQTCPAGRCLAVGQNAATCVSGDPCAVCPSGSACHVEEGSPARVICADASSAPLVSGPAEPGQDIRVYFATNTGDFLDPPAERHVAAPDAVTLYRNALATLLSGPNAAEQGRGAVQAFQPELRFGKITTSDSGIRCIRAPCPTQIVHVDFSGPFCESNPPGVNLASLVFKTIEQFPDVHAVKITLDGKTRAPEGSEDSSPLCPSSAGTGPPPTEQAIP